MISREDVIDILLDIERKNKMNENNKNSKQFIIDVGEYLKVTTPYSDNHFIYDDINYCLDDLQFCLEVEVKKNEKKNEKIEG